MTLRSFRSVARKSLERLLRYRGYRLTELDQDPVGLSRTCEILKRRGFSPRTVIDVGVGDGTPWLYANFSTAQFELFEPNAAFRSSIEASTSSLARVNIHYCALGAEDAEMTLEVNIQHPTSSSLSTYNQTYLKATDSTLCGTEVRREKVQVQKLDDFAPFEGPVLLKLDVEGFESQVLRGAATALKTIDVVISEVSIARRTLNEPTFGEFVSQLEALGFSLVNIAEIVSIGRGGPIAYMDAVFVRSDSPLRLGTAFA